MRFGRCAKRLILASLILLHGLPLTSSHAALALGATSPRGAAATAAAMPAVGQTPVDDVDEDSADEYPTVIHEDSVGAVLVEHGKRPRAVRGGVRFRQGAAVHEDVELPSFRARSMQDEDSSSSAGGDSTASPTSTDSSADGKPAGPAPAPAAGAGPPLGMLLFIRNIPILVGGFGIGFLGGLVLWFSMDPVSFSTFLARRLGINPVTVTGTAAAAA